MADLDVRDGGDVVLGQVVEDDRFVDAVEELRAEVLLEGLAQVRFDLPFLGFLLGQRAHDLGGDVGGHDDDGVLEVDGASLPVGEPAVVEHLQEHVEHVAVGRLDLVEQDHAVRPAADRLGQSPAFLIADVARRGADHAGHRVLLHELAHVDADDGLLGVEQQLGQGLAQLGLAHPGRPQE